MAIYEIQAKTLLASNPHPDPWFGIRYNMNIYRGCEHQCIYCDSRSECYQIENFADVLVKVNAIERLEDELPRKRQKGIIGTGSMSDPYGPVESVYNLTGRAMQVIARRGFPVHIITKSDLILKDIEALAEIAREYAAISFTITTTDDALALQIEPGAPPPSRRFTALAALAARGAHVGVTMMPLLPHITDTAENITAIMTRAHECGASYVMPGYGLTMRNRQREYFYDKLDGLFPGLRPRYERAYGESYQCTSPRAPYLSQGYEELRIKFGLGNRVPPYTPRPATQQLTLF